MARFRLRFAPKIQFWRRVPQPLPRLDPGNDAAHPSSRALRLVRRLHPVIVLAPERVVVNAACILIGLSAWIAHEPGSVIHSWPLWLQVSFGLGMMIGGSAVLIGMFKGQRSVERLGYVLVGAGCLLYGISALILRGLTGIPAFLIFLGIAIAKVIRLLVSTAERDLTIELGEQMDRDEEDS